MNVADVKKDRIKAHIGQTHTNANTRFELRKSNHKWQATTATTEYDMYMYISATATAPEAAAANSNNIQLNEIEIIIIMVVIIIVCVAECECVSIYVALKPHAFDALSYILYRQMVTLKLLSHISTWLRPSHSRSWTDRPTNE